MQVISTGSPGIQGYADAATAVVKAKKINDVQAEIIRKYPGRFAIWHIKDLKKGFPPSTDKVEGNPFAEVGAGTIDWKRVFKRASQAGLKHYFVEQDRWDRAPLECAKASCDFLKKLKV